MTRVLLPALHGDDSLGFLAALGLLSLSEQGEISPLTLAWEDTGSPTAAVEGVDSASQLAQELRAAFERLRQRDAALPNVGADFPIGGDTQRFQIERAGGSLFVTGPDIEKALREGRDSPDWTTTLAKKLKAAGLFRYLQRRGAGLQEVYLNQGRVEWRSSDGNGVDPRSDEPSVDNRYLLEWTPDPAVTVDPVSLAVPAGRHLGGTGPDPMRMPRSDMAQLYESAGDQWTDNPWFARWLVAFAGQAAEDGKRVPLTPFNAPAGNASLRGSVFELVMKAVNHVQGPGDALTRWRRTDEFKGANFDLRALRDGTVTTSGKANNLGAPSATWLAAMAIRLFPLADNGRTVEAVAWQRVRLYPGYTRRSLIWPVWGLALSAPAVRALLAHPYLRIELGKDYQVRVPHARMLPALQLLGLYGASRSTTTQGDGPLGPTRRLWVAP